MSATPRHLRAATARNTAVKTSAAATRAWPKYDGVAKKSVVEFVTAVTTRSGKQFVPVGERIAVFDNDGTLWTEKPMPTQLHYVVEQWRAAAQRSPELTERQPYRAAVSGDFRRLPLGRDGAAWEDLPGGTPMQGMNLATDGRRVFVSGGYPKNNTTAVEADGSGNALLAFLEREPFTEVVSAFGELGRRAEDVARALLAQEPDDLREQRHVRARQDG